MLCDWIDLSIDIITPNDAIYYRLERGYCQFIIDKGKMILRVKIKTN